MFQNVLITAVTPLANTNEIRNWENRPFTAVWPTGSTFQQPQPKDTDETIGRTIKKKPRRFRTKLTDAQVYGLEKLYSQQRFIDGETRRRLSNCLNLAEKTIKIWFQNRRMKDRRQYLSSDLSSDGSSESVSTASTVDDGLNYQTTESDQTSESSINNTGNPIFHYASPPWYQSVSQIGGSSYNYFKRNHVGSGEFQMHKAKSNLANYYSSFGNFIEGNTVINPTVLPPAYFQMTESNTQKARYSANFGENNNNVQVAQYEFPNYYNPAISNNMAAMLFVNDRSVYPTEYYPGGSNYSNAQGAQNNNYEMF